jgi:hypothetical protein
MANDKQNNVKHFNTTNNIFVGLYYEVKNTRTFTATPVHS